jgi:hypothetical protein
MVEMARPSEFNDGNDPMDEHDFGSFELGHYTFNWRLRTTTRSVRVLGRSVRLE